MDVFEKKLEPQDLSAKKSVEEHRHWNYFQLFDRFGLSSFCCLILEIIEDLCDDINT